jgi:ribosomal protein S18 acetylase RimI-like enzyme
MSSEVLVQRAGPEHVAPAAQLAGSLVRMHHQEDPGRFLLPERVEAGYTAWFTRELQRQDAVLLVALRAGVVVGYAYGALEARDWNLLLDRHGAIHDIFVVESERRGGVGRRLMEGMVTELEAKGAPSIVLSTMVGNSGAQALFRACGFRATMLEMTRSR